MGQGKGPGPWEEMGLGSLPRVTQANLKRSIKGQLSVGGGVGGRARGGWKSPRVTATICSPPTPTILTHLACTMGWPTSQRAGGLRY